jgi:SAM-dependent methyltransferase
VSPSSTEPSLIEVSACPYCTSGDLTVAYTGVRDHLHVSAAAWTYMRCRDCGSLLLSPRPSAAGLAALYPDNYVAAPGQGGSGGLIQSAIVVAERVFFGLQYRAQRRLVLKGTSVPSTPAPALLDVGCGNGRRLLQFRDLGMNVQGVDFRAAPADDVRRAGLPVHECNVEHLDDVVSAESIDIVTAFYVIEHVGDVRRMIGACRTVLRAGGWLAVAVPLAAGCQEIRCGARWSQIVEAPRHTTIPSLRGLTCLLTHLGFRDISVVPESALARGAMLALSVVPESAGSLVASDPSLPRLLRRILVGAALVPGVACAVAEDRLWRRPSAVIVVARKDPSKAPAAR